MRESVAADSVKSRSSFKFAWARCCLAKPFAGQLPKSKCAWPSRALSASEILATDETSEMPVDDTKSGRSAHVEQVCDDSSHAVEIDARAGRELRVRRENVARER